jgi:DNA-binding transcriptional LysR family regulator
MDLRQLKYFIVVAESGSITAAAERLRIAQPAVTRQIQSLEDELGTRLLDRMPRGVSPTVAGHVLLRDARRILAEVDLTAERTRLAANGGEGHLRIGFNETYSLNSVLAMSLREFRRLHPGASLHVASMNTRAQIAALRSGELDFGFFYDRNSRDAELGADIVMIDRVRVAVPQNSPLVSKHHLKLSDLSESEFIWFPRDKDPWFYAQLMAACKAAGFTPRISQEAVNDSSMLALVAAGLGIAFVPGAAGLRTASTLAFLEPSDLHIDLHLEVVWRAGNLSPLVSEFRHIVGHVKASLAEGNA